MAIYYYVASLDRFIWHPGSESRHYPRTILTPDVSCGIPDRNQDIIPGQYSPRTFHVASRIGIKTLSPDHTHPGRFMWHPGSESRHYPQTILTPDVSCGIPDRNQDIIPGQYSPRTFHVASRIRIKTLSPDNTHPGRFMWHPGSESRHYPRTILTPDVSCGIPDQNQDIIPGQYSPRTFHVASRIGIKTLSPDNTHPGRFMWHPGSESRHYPRTILTPDVSCGIPDRNQDIIPGPYSPRTFHVASRIGIKTLSPDNTHPGRFM